MKHLNIGSVIDKSKLSSKAAFVPLFEVALKGVEGVDFEPQTLRFCRWSEDLTFEDHLFVASDFDFEVSTDANEMPTAKLTGYDPSATIHRLLEQAHGAADSEVRLIIVNTEEIAAKNWRPEYEEHFLVSRTSVKGGRVEFQLGMPNYTTIRFPRRIMMSQYCSFLFKDERCGYTGGLASCDYSLRGENGCIAHQNSENFGGFPSISAQ